MNEIPDIQSSKDLRNIPINQVGIKDLRFPVSVRSQSGEQATVARFTMTVFLPAEQKGTHMSRFVALLEEFDSVLDWGSLKTLTLEMLARLDSHAGKLSVSFPFFRKKSAPVSGIESLLDYDVSLTGEVSAKGEYSGSLKVLIPVTSLCPCSKEISQYGAHNQRSHVTVSLQCVENVAVEEVLDWVEAQASSQLYGLLKRPDEKFVTERAYENPKFVEDMVRDIAAVLLADKRISAFTVESENFESIHNHSAYALIQYP
ncbi:GTP cyclohydrolase FolE2 [Kingella negevensis]|uniref:GTP cyclohydrolase FolE2 n=1 Tax=Kingella negevensis TaxID=1522312 RepID=A0A238T9E9_9NEIS|nr:GTP cyclohydrolase FolE2 [Kingella negevensis]MDK4681311.1 GTP cyclohydrolase FolE2 [Kingella negevensis]MDK4683508.1 GTP cyclohydrolase FolE2 [Kingella negevensis]MDK4684047.1 GTP cyclohydrolase FolE2 [Kingella negevensis]MDK4691357.1 GTP cyclohydrolase FolE2 [Kingella negevensis]MDK4693494.1 GTP cyclohydrolase FolE2 [Kingella negevensis]